MSSTLATNVTILALDSDSRQEFLDDPQVWLDEKLEELGITVADDATKTRFQEALKRICSTLDRPEDPFPEEGMPDIADHRKLLGRGEDRGQGRLEFSGKAKTPPVRSISFTANAVLKSMYWCRYSENTQSSRGITRDRYERLLLLLLALPASRSSGQVPPAV